VGLALGLADALALGLADALALGLADALSLGLADALALGLADMLAEAVADALALADGLGLGYADGDDSWAAFPLGITVPTMNDVAHRTAMRKAMNDLGLRGSRGPGWIRYMGAPPWRPFACGVDPPSGSVGARWPASSAGDSTTLHRSNVLVPGIPGWSSARRMSLTEPIALSQCDSVVCSNPGYRQVPAASGRLDATATHDMNGFKVALVKRIVARAVDTAAMWGSQTMDPTIGQQVGRIDGNAKLSASGHDSARIAHVGMADGGGP
jgi:hypothetical protein